MSIHVVVFGAGEEIELLEKKLRSTFTSEECEITVDRGEPDEKSKDVTLVARNGKFMLAWTLEVVANDPRPDTMERLKELFGNPIDALDNYLNFAIRLKLKN